MEGALITVRVTRAAQGGKGPRLTASLAQSPGPPGLITRGPGSLLELAAQYPDAPVVADDLALVAALRPALAERIGYAARLLDDELAEQIDSLTRPELELPGGMRATITPTPALVAIDVDMGGGERWRPAEGGGAVCGQSGGDPGAGAADPAAQPVRRDPDRSCRAERQTPRRARPGARRLHWPPIRCGPAFWASPH